MRLRFERRVGRYATAVAAALFVAAVGFGSAERSLAQNYQKKDRAQKGAPPAKGQVQQQRRNAMPGGMMPNRGFRGQALGPNAVPNARNAERRQSKSQGPGVKGPNAGGPNAVNPRADAFGKGGPSAGAQGQNQSQNPNARGLNSGQPLRQHAGQHQSTGRARLRQQPGRRRKPAVWPAPGRVWQPPEQFCQSPGRVRQPAQPVRQPPGLREQPFRRTRLHQSRSTLARRERRNAAAASGATLQPSHRDVRGARAHAGLSPARRAEFHRRAAGRRNEVRAHRNGLPVRSRRDAGRRSPKRRGGTTSPSWRASAPR